MYNTLPQTLFLGKSFTYLPTCHSTNQVALEMISGQPDTVEGTVVITSHQTAGKGQRGNSWEAEPGANLTFSVILNPGFLAISDQFYLNIISALALYDLLQPILGKELKVKWPNDIYYKDKKIAGILIQNTIKKSRIENSVLGVGLNINQTVFREPKAISLKSITGKDTQLNEILNNLLEQLEGLYLKLKAGSFEELKRNYLNALYWYGETRIFQAQESFKGSICGIDPIGRLNVEIDGVVQTFDFKEIQYIG